MSKYNNARRVLNDNLITVDDAIELLHALADDIRDEEPYAVNSISALREGADALMILEDEA